MDLNSVLSKVRSLVALAEHPDTPSAEAESARSMADALMLKYAIDEAELDKSRPAAERSKPAVIEVALTGEYELTGYVAQMARIVADNCRCQIRQYTSWHDGSWQSKVYGFESDLRYFEVLYTTLRLHMIGALHPSIDPNKSLEDNAYALHNAGMDWPAISQMYGWRKVYSQPGEPKHMYENKKTGERAPWSKAVGQFKNAYRRASEARGEKAFRISGHENYRTSAAHGYVARITQRLREQQKNRGSSGEIVLATRAADLSDFFRSENQDLFVESTSEPCEACNKAKSGHCRAHPKGRSYGYKPLNEDAYQAGVRHANTANFSSEVPGSSPTPLN